MWTFKARSSLIHRSPQMKRVSGIEYKNLLPCGDNKRFGEIVIESSFHIVLYRHPFSFFSFSAFLPEPWTRTHTSRLFSHISRRLYNASSRCILGWRSLHILNTTMSTVLKFLLICFNIFTLWLNLFKPRKCSVSKLFYTQLNLLRGHET